MTSPDRKSGQFAGALGLLWPLLLIGAVVALAGLGGDTARLGMRYDNAAVESGELWRLLTGHFVHLGWQHVLLNLAGLALVVLLFPREYRATQWLAIVATCIALISAGFVFLRPDLVWYVGLSGVLHGLFLAGAVRWISRSEIEGYVLALFLAGKLIWEQLHGALPLSVASAGGAVVVDSHLYGALAGLASSLLLCAIDYRQTARDGRSRHR